MTIMDCNIPKGSRLGIKPIYRASQVIINTNKGRDLWKDIVSEEKIDYEEFPVEKMVEVEKRLRHPAKNRKGNEIFLRISKILSFENTIRFMYPLSRKLKRLVEREE